MSGYEDCARQRNLTDRGRAEARDDRRGDSAPAHSVGEVLASPFCRTRETARLIFGRATRRRGRCAAALRADDGSDALCRAATLAVDGAARPATVLAIASHGNPFRRGRRHACTSPKAKPRSCGRWVSAGFRVDRAHSRTTAWSRARNAVRPSGAVRGDTTGRLQRTTSLVCPNRIFRSASVRDRRRCTD